MQPKANQILGICLAERHLSANGHVIHRYPLKVWETHEGSGSSAGVQAVSCG